MIILRSCFKKLLLVAMAVWFPLDTHASHGFGCISVDKKLIFGVQNYEGDGWLSSFEDFGVTFEGKKIKSGLFNWLKESKDGFSFTIFSLFGRQVHLVSRGEHRVGPEGDGLLYKITSGFIVIEGLKIDIADLEIECGGG